MYIYNAISWKTLINQYTSKVEKEFYIKPHIYYIFIYFKNDQILAKSDITYYLSMGHTYKFFNNEQVIVGKRISHTK